MFFYEFEKPALTRVWYAVFMGGYCMKWLNRTLFDVSEHADSKNDSGILHIFVQYPRKVHEKNFTSYWNGDTNGKLKSGWSYNFLVNG